MKEKSHELLTITVEDFGPIKEGKVTLKPLTIFFGKNNTGKTYIGYLIWGITKNDPFIGRKVQGHDKLIELLKNYTPSTQHTSSRKFPFGSYEYAGEVDIFPTILLTKENVQSLFNFPIQFKQAKALIPTQIKLKIGIELKEKISKDESLLENFHKLSFPNSLKPRFGFAKGPSKKNENEHEIKEYEFEVIVLRDTNTNEYYVCITAPPRILENEAKHIAMNIVNNIINYEFRRVISNPIFIPASKSGFVLLSKLLAKNLLEEKFSRQYKLIRYTSEEEEKELELSLPGPIVDFIKKDPTFSQSYSENPKTEFEDIIEFLENNLLKGRLEYNKNLNLISYLPSLSESLSLPPQYSSSLVVESIPLLLYLKYTDFIRKKTLVIMEEPEAHLHPDAQRILAKALIKLVNRGVYVILITHSPYILQQINNNIKLYYLKKNGKEKELKEFLEKHGWEENEIIDPSKIAPYLFDDSEGYTKIRELDIIENDGISSEAFYHTIRELFNETYELINLLESDNNERAE
ncbi:hypothetical protein DRN44_04690 [Thermococci archaeon]|nr:MAG: hypothetical protein DRN44_04690 [Thermococci archaeon]